MGIVSCCLLSRTGSFTSSDLLSFVIQEFLHAVFPLRPFSAYQLDSGKWVTLSAGAEIFFFKRGLCYA